MTNVPISNSKLLTLTTDENELKMFLFEKMMRPRINDFYKKNTIIINSLHDSHQRLIEKFFVRNNDGSIKYTEGDKIATPEIYPEPIYKSGMTKEMFQIEEKEWSLKTKTMSL